VKAREREREREEEREREREREREKGVGVKENPRLFHKKANARGGKKLDFAESAIGVRFGKISNCTGLKCRLSNF
jgi:hypothetical protein